MKNEVIKALEANNPALAIAKAKILVEENPSNHEALLLLGDTQMRMIEYHEAIQSYQAAKHITPLDPVVYKKIGIAYAKIGNWNRAVGVFQAALGLLPEEPLLKGLLGWSMWSSGDKYATEKAYQLMVYAVDMGISYEPINNALAEYHLNQATSSWHKINTGENKVIATKLSHLIDAEKELNSAENYIITGENYATKKLDELKEKIDSLKERSFYGYPFLRKAPIVASGIALIFMGNIPLSIFMLFMAGLYHASQNKPKYLANQMHVKGDYGDPFWIRNMNNGLRYLDTFSFYSTSFSNVIFMSWAFSIFGITMKYLLALAALPLSIVAGLYKNYDLFDNVVELIKSKK